MGRYDNSPFRADPLSRREIRNEAMRLRQLLGIEDKLWVNVIHILENVLPIIDKEFYFEIVPDGELDAHARAFPEDHYIKIRESIYDGARTGKGRDRLTVMHEFYHYIRHGKETISLARNPETVKIFENPEWQADVFAGEFLMPWNAIRNMSVAQIVQKCGVSERAAIYQLKKAKQ